MIPLLMRSPCRVFEWAGMAPRLVRGRVVSLRVRVVRLLLRRAVLGLHERDFQRLACWASGKLVLALVGLTAPR